MTSPVSPTSSENSNSVLQNYLAQQAQTAAAAKTAATASGNGANTLQGVTGNFSTFLKILTTQLKNQDPTSATDPNQFTQELVQFAGVEQQLNTNSDLQTLINLNKTSSGVTAALSYIGKYIEAPATNQLPLQGKQAELAYTLPAGVSHATINITDANGKTVATLAGSTTAGLNRVAWDGKDANGTQLADGTYGFQLTATAPGGGAVSVTDVRTVGLVTGVQSNSDGTTSLQLTSDMVVKSSAIDAVYDASSLPQGKLGDATAASSTSSSSS